MTDRFIEGLLLSERVGLIVPACLNEPGKDVLPAGVGLVDLIVGYPYAS